MAMQTDCCISYNLIVRMRIYSYRCGWLSVRLIVKVRVSRVRSVMARVYGKGC